MKRLLLALLFLTQLAACVTTRYEYHQPRSSEGRICTAQCLNSKQQCETMSSMAYNQCRQNYNISQQLYNQCKKRDKKDKSCIQPTYCYQDRDDCEDNYRECFKACGGKIRVVEEE